MRAEVREAGLQAERAGSDPAPLPLLFSSASFLPSHASLWHIPWGGGGCRPGDPSLASSPAPPARRAGAPPPIVPRGWGEGAALRDPPRPNRRVAGTLGAAPTSPGGSGPGGDHPHPAKGRARAAYRDVRDALLALVRHGPGGARARWRTWGLSFPRPGSLSAPLPAGAVTKPGRDAEARSSRPRRARCPAPACAPPLRRQHRPAPRGAGGGGRARRRRARQTHSASRRREPSPIRPAGRNRGALPFRSPHSAPAPQIARLADPARCAPAASLSRWGRAGAQGSF